MPIETVSGTDLKYYLIAFDANGVERIDDPAGQMSRLAMEAAQSQPVTDVFLFSHGWISDMEYARVQYNKWVGAMAQCKNVIVQRPAGGPAERPDFMPLLIGVHWPSRPWSNESFNTAPVSFDVMADSAGEAAAVERAINEYAAGIADTPQARDALRTVLSAAQAGTLSTGLTAEVSEAYKALEREAGLDAKGLDAPPGADRPPFDPQAIIEEATESENEAGLSFGLIPGLSLDALLMPLRLLSFWKMKDRARRFGESGAHRLLADLQAAAGAENGVRFHLMGHSFGCIVVSGMLAGPPEGGAAIRAVDSLVLAQGAMSLWSYCSEIPSARGRAGYFRRLIEQSRVSGPIITTQSRHDLAVGRFYPMGVGLTGEVDFTPGQLPKYGGVGTWGLQGTGLEIRSRPMLPASESYGFEGATIYNLDGSVYIAHMDPGTGAHSDIARPEVAHAVWEAALPR